MVVLTRRPHEKLLIPAINASLHVAAIEPGVVRVAVEAPPEVAVLRGELYSQTALAAAASPTEKMPARSDDIPRVRKRLADVSRALGLARLELSAGLTRDAGTVLRRLHREVQRLRRELGGRKRRVPLRGASFPTIDANRGLTP